MKHVFFDTTFLHYGDDLRGIPQVILQLVRLFRDDKRFREIRFIATRKVFKKRLAPLGIAPERVAIVKPPPLFLNTLRFHGAFAAWRYRKLLPNASFIIHPEHRTVIGGHLPQAVIFYDFIYLEEERIERKKPTVRSLGRSLYLVYLMRKFSIASRVSHKITISEYTRSELLRRFPSCAPASVTALCIGFRNSLSEGPRLAKGDLKKGIQYLYVGGILESRKNVRALLQNFGSFPQPGETRLHLAGGVLANGVNNKTMLTKKLRELGLENRVVIHGLVDDVKLRSLYQQAHFFLFPSLMEGFGLPLIEAMANGTVACAFRNSSIPEVAGECAILRENNDFAGWTDEIQKMISRPGSYDELSKRSVECAMQFSEEKMFKRYGDYFESVLFAKSGLLSRRT